MIFFNCVGSGKAFVIKKRRVGVGHDGGAALS